MAVDKIPIPATEVTENEAGLSLLSLVGTTQFVIDPNEQHVVKHPCYAVLKSAQRGNMKNMHYRIDLIHNILNLEPSTYLQYPYCDSAHVKLWYKKYRPYLNHPRKWNHDGMATAICELDQIMENGYKNAEVEDNPKKLP